ncbi:MAG: hypothetical protein JW981_04590 [Anaerolineae bacterium]|nr:hypothetical protein [Anaerolineae bacterium]
MAKKSKKSTPRLSAAQLYTPDGAAPAVILAAQKESPMTVPTETDLAAEYHYVIRDLRRIGILALIMLGVLVGLAFVLV